jgi:hypothetical protein
MCNQTPVAETATIAAKTTLIRENLDRFGRSFEGLEGTEENGFGLYSQARNTNCTSVGIPRSITPVDLIYQDFRIVLIPFFG